MATERCLGYEPSDVSGRKIGYDVESRVPGTGQLRFLEVKGQVVRAKTVTVTRNEILTGLNKPESFILSIVQVDREANQVYYIRQPFARQPDFGVESVNYNLNGLLARAEAPA